MGEDERKKAGRVASVAEARLAITTGCHGNRTLTATTPSSCELDDDHETRDWRCSTSHGPGRDGVFISIIVEEHLSSAKLGYLFSHVLLRHAGSAGIVLGLDRFVVDCKAIRERDERRHMAQCAESRVIIGSSRCIYLVQLGRSNLRDFSQSSTVL